MSEALRLAELLTNLKFTVKGRDNAEAMEEAATELRRLHAENEALREANEAFGKRQEWWNDRMFEQEQRYMALVKAMADAKAMQMPTIHIDVDVVRLRALNAELVEALWAASNHIDALGGDSKGYRVALAKAQGEMK